MKPVFSMILVCLMILAVGTHSSADCNVTVEDLNFGMYDVSAANPMDGTGTIRVSCVPSTTFIIKFDAGKHSGGSFNPRRMSSSGNTLVYNIYQDASCSAIWGDGTSGTLVHTGTGDELFTIYGRIFEMQNIPPGSYSDTLMFTVEW